MRIGRIRSHSRYGSCGVSICCFWVNPQFSPLVAMFEQTRCAGRVSGLNCIGVNGLAHGVAGLSRITNVKNAMGVQREGPSMMLGPLIWQRYSPAFRISHFLETCPRSAVGVNSTRTRPPLTEITYRLSPDLDTSSGRCCLGLPEQTDPF